MSINVLYEDNHIIVINKPINIPTQADDSGDKDVLTLLKEYLKEKYNKPGNVYLGLVHRLDRPVGGVMVFAKTSKAASRLSEEIRKGNLKKRYLAVVEGYFDNNEGTLIDYLLKNTNTNMVTVDKNGKESILKYKILSYFENKSLVDIELITGRSHQIRVQFASRNHPLFGDQRYNRNAKVGQQIALFSYSLSFIHPVTKKNMNFNLDRPNQKPWDLF